MTRIYDYNPYSKPHPNSPLNMAGKRFPAIAPPESGWEILSEPESDKDYPYVIFVELDSSILEKGLSYNKLRRDLKFLASDPSRNIVIEINDTDINDRIVKMLTDLHKVLSKGKRNPYRITPPILTGKLAIYMTSDTNTLYDKLQNKGLKVFKDWDETLSYISEDLEPQKDKWVEWLDDSGKVKPNPEAVKKLIDELSNKNTPAREPLSEKDIAFNKLIDEMSRKNIPSIITSSEKDIFLKNKSANEVEFYMGA